MSQRNFNATLIDAVKRLDAFFVSQSASTASTYGDKESLISHIDQAIFNSKDVKKSSKQASMNELEIANEICMYCARQKAEYVRYCVFDAIFSMTRPSGRTNRRRVLAITASLAIALKSSSVLECVALWLATTPKEHAIYLASSLEKDYCFVMPESATELKGCNKTSEKFSAMLISALCAKYTMKNSPQNIYNNATEYYPSSILLDVMQQWVIQKPKIIFCVVSQIDQVWHTVLTTTRNHVECLPLSPLAGLIEWSIKLPFAPAEYCGSKSAHVDIDYSRLHSKLHYAILVAITLSQECQRMINQGILGKESDFKLWSKSDAHAVVGILIACASNNPISEKMNLAVDRFAQICQVAMTYCLFAIAKEQFQSLTDPLPQTKLLELVAYGTEKPVEDVHMA